MKALPENCPFCGGGDFEEVFVYVAPPAGEVGFQDSSATYRRDVAACTGCGHFLSTHEMPLDEIYDGQYVDCTYGAGGIREAFDRITSLDPESSDNYGRVSRILEFADRYFGERAGELEAPSVLDVGSGLCVFLHRMKDAGWNCTALDPDERAAAHAREVVGVSAVCADFMDVDDLPRFDVVAFNKVLEHVEDPIEMLRRSARFLRPEGFVYVELPDGEGAVRDGPEREEFFIEHHHVFSLASMARLGTKAGFEVIGLERVREPSGKYTLRGFMRVAHP